MRNQLLGNRYRVLDRIGEGGMAYVYLAMDEKLGRKVAVKVLHEHMEKNPDIRKRFQMEAEAVSSLDHPNIVRIYDFSGEAQATGPNAGRLWIVTEVIRGKNLAQYVQQFTGGWLHPVIAACVVREICKALDAAHAQGIVHRDVKPENAMLTTEGRVKLMDFGIAKDTGKTSMTLTGTFMGSPSYMSPEQIRGRDVDHRSDLYSLAVLFYEVVTGRLPFSGNTTHDVVLKIMEGGFTHPRFIVPSLPDRLNDMIVRGMSKDPGQRYQTARAFGSEIDDFLKRAGFDESHIELERYFKDRQAYEQRLAKTSFGGAAALNIRQTRRPTVATVGPGARQAATQSARQSVVQAARAAREQTQKLPASPLPAPPPFKADDTWQRHMAHQKTVRETRHDQSARAPTQHVPPAPSVNAEARATRMPTQVMLQQQATQAHYVPSYAAVDASSPRRQAGYPPPRARQRRTNGRRAAYVLRFAEARASLLGYLLGAVLVGVFGLVSIWGFWELQDRLSNPSRASRPAVTVKTKDPRVTRRPASKRDGTPSTIKHLTKKRPAPAVAPPQSPAASRPDKTPRTAQTGGKRRTKGKQTTRPVPTVVQAVAVAEASDPNLSVEAVEVKRPKRPDATAVATPAPASAQPQPAQPQPATPAPVAPPSEPAVAAQPAAPASEPDEGEKPKAGGKGKVSVSSEPAAEIFIDGRRMGTTLDGTTSSGWLTLTSGTHTLVLRRQGYETHRSRFEVAAGDQRALPKVVLEPAGGASSSNALTLRVSHVPAQVTVRNLENNTTQAFVMKAPSRVVQLENGRYQIKVEHKGETKERELNLGGAGQLTFTADFKDE